MTTTEKGTLTELKIAVQFLEQGKIVLRSVGEGCRYDLLVDNGDGTFIRIQCKTGWLKNGVISFNAISHYRWTDRCPRYAGQADVFGVYCKDTDGIYVVPVDAIKSNRGRLRTTPTLNNQSKGILLAEDFAVPKM